MAHFPSPTESKTDGDPNELLIAYARLSSTNRTIASAATGAAQPPTFLRVPCLSFTNRTIASAAAGAAQPPTFLRVPTGLKYCNTCHRFVPFPLHFSRALFQTFPNLGGNCEECSTRFRIQYDHFEKLNATQ